MNFVPWCIAAMAHRRQQAWDNGCGGSYQRPTIDLHAFPNTPSAVFWSSSPLASNGGLAWGVSFHFGLDGWYFNDSAFQVRLVRSGQ
jgi:hypothetical protein